MFVTSPPFVESDRIVWSISPCATGCYVVMTAEYLNNLKTTLDLQRSYVIICVFNICAFVADLD